MSTYNEDGQMQFLISSGATTPVQRGQRMKLDLANDSTGQSVTQAQLSDGANFVGWATEDVNPAQLSQNSDSSSPGAVVQVRLKNTPGTFFVQVSGAIPAGKEILADNAGQMRAGSTGAGATLGLITYEASSEAGDIIQVGPGGAASL